jgi:predicted TPR repeat methyltransferase
MPGINLKLADDFAAFYDESVLKNDWNSPQILYHEVFELLEQNSSILDLGIGTGASSVLFQKAGHRITGLDGSAQMLEQCKKKQIAETLVLHDLEKTPFPFKNSSFDAVISCGVFHLVHPISNIFAEIKRLLAPGGYFVFTFENVNDTATCSEVEPGIWETKTEYGVLCYKHAALYISNILFRHGFEIHSQKRFMAFRSKELDKEFYFTAILAKLKQNRQR